MAANNRTSNVIKNSGASILNRLVQMMIQFVIRTVFIHVLGNEYTGISSLFTDILQVLSLMELGLDASMTYSLYKPLSRNDTAKVASLLNFYRSAFNLIGVGVLVSGVICTPFLKYIIKGVPNITEDIRGIFLMYVATTAFSYFMIYRTILLNADQQSRIAMNVRTITMVIETGIEVVLLFIFRKFYAYLIIRFFSVIIRNLIITYITTKKYPNYFKGTCEPLPEDEKRILLRDLACLTVYNTSGVVINSTDSIFISAFTGTVEVAIITNFTLITNSVRSAVNQVVNAAKPSIGNLAATRSEQQQKVVFDRMNFIAFAVSCICCTCFMTLLNPFVGDIWFNESYKIPQGIIFIIVINFYIAVMVFPMESFRSANGLFVQGWIRPAVMAVMNIVLDFYMGKRWGIGGIFLATTISRVLTQVWYDPYLVYKHVFKEAVGSYYLDYVKYFVITMSSCLLSFFVCQRLIIPNRFLNIIIRGLISVAIPSLFIWVIFRNTTEFEYIEDMMKKVRKKLLKH